MPVQPGGKATCSVETRLEKHNYPQPHLTAEEQAFIDGPVEEACRMANDFQITHELADLPPELWAYLKNTASLR